VSASGRKIYIYILSEERGGQQQCSTGHICGTLEVSAPGEKF
jgi:hypothetical protein